MNKQITEKVNTGEPGLGGSCWLIYRSHGNNTSHVCSSVRLLSFVITQNEIIAATWTQTAAALLLILLKFLTVNVTLMILFMLLFIKGIYMMQF